MISILKALCSLPNRYVVELGAGTGLIGLVLAQVGAQVALTDQKSMIPLMEQNVQANPAIPSHLITVAELFWYG